MCKKLFGLLVGLLVIAGQIQAQLPSKKELFNYTKNSFHIPGHKANDNFPFLVVVIPNKIKPYPGNTDALSDSLYKDRAFRANRSRYMMIANFDSSKALVFVQGVTKKKCAGL